MEKREMEKKIKAALNIIENDPSGDEVRNALKEVKRLGKNLSQEELRNLAACGCGPHGEPGIEGIIFC